MIRNLPEIIIFIIGVFLFYLNENYQLVYFQFLRISSFGLLTIPLLVVLMKGFRFPWFSIFAVSTSLLIFIVHFCFTSSNDYMYDLAEHKALIIIFSKTWWPVPVGGTWLSYHPPLYYYFEAIFYKIEAIIGIQHFSLVRFSNLFLYITFQLAGIKILTFNLKDRWILNLAITFLVFFPIGDFYSARINNDSLLYPLWALSIYFFERWLKYRQKNILNLTFFSVALAIITKANAYLILLSLLILITTKNRGFSFLKPKEILNLAKANKLPIILILSAMSVTSGRLILNRFNNGNHSNLVVANYSYDFETTGKVLRIFDIKLSDAFNLLQPPFAETFDIKPDGILYSVNFFKTFLYGESFRNHPEIARYLNIIFLNLILSLTILLFIFRKSLLVPESVFLLVPLLGHFLNTLTKPVICTSDARYVFPILIPLTVLLCKYSFEAANSRSGVLRLIGNFALINLISFSGLSFCFLIGQHLF